jgi:hypothetical protein
MKMKDKRAEQIAAKARHKEQHKAKRRGEPSLERKAPSLTLKPTILIVCEGINTEPSYFRQFRLSSATIKTVGGGRNTISLVTKAIQLSKQNNYDQVWCVFDKDDFSVKDFNNAIVIAKANNLLIAYSNQAFEYWILLHLDDHQGGQMQRKDYNKKINELLIPFKLSYDGTMSKIITQEIFGVLESVDAKSKKKRLDLAIMRAKRNFNKFDHSNPASEESSTTVYMLVEEINKYR